MVMRAGKTRTFTVSFPRELAERVDQMAARENRTISELFREAFRTYRGQQIRVALADQRLRNQAGGVEGYGEEELERFVGEDG